MRLKDLEMKADEEISGLEVNYDILSIEAGQTLDIVRGSDFALVAEKTSEAGAMVYYLQYEGKREIVGFLDPDELEELEEELVDFLGALKRGEEGARGVKPRVHIHKRPRCRDTGKPAYCGHRRCFGGVAMHVACVNWPFGSKKKLCTCLGVT